VERNLLSRIRSEISGEQSFGIVALLGILTTLLALGLFSYLGSFSRYGGDDYCLSAFFFQKGGFWASMVERYVHSSSRYTNILFIGFVDKLLGWYNVAILPPLMIALFVFGFYLFLNEIMKFVPLAWNRFASLFIAALIVYFSVVEAPNLYETLYWRAGMTSHFAPMVFLTFLGAYIVRQIWNARKRSPSILSLIICFAAAFIIGGFSEPPVAMVITMLVLAIAVIWFRDDAQFRRFDLSILGWALAGSLVALAVLALAPANGLRLAKAPPNLFNLIIKTFKYPSEFIADEFLSFPIPVLISIILPSVLFIGINLPQHANPLKSRNQIPFLMIAVAFLGYLLIASSFAPSVYGQSYPVPRARFAGLVILTCALITEGALIGLWIARIGKSLSGPTSLRGVAVMILLLLSLYPLRTVVRNAADIPVYQTRASAWDLRDAEIRKLKADGIQDIVIPFLSKEIIQDLGDHSEFRLNRCAASIYGVHSILAKSRH